MSRDETENRTTGTDEPTPAPAIPANDDSVLPFRTERAGATGRLIRLGTSVDEILNRHNYPEPVSRALGEALALTAMLGTTLKNGGRLTLQTSSDGPLRMLVTNFDAPGKLRGYASFDPSLQAQEVNDGQPPSGHDLFGNGHMALTMDPGGDLDRYQGIVALDGGTIADAALTYFRQSEQLPTYLKLVVARAYVSQATPSAHNAGDEGAEAASRRRVTGKPGWQWRAGGILVQYVARTGGKPAPTATPGSGPTDKTDAAKTAAIEKAEERGDLIDEHDEDWNRTRLLAQTVEDHELLDPDLASEHLAFRLFHEEGVRAFTPVAIEASCRCSRERVEAFIGNFSAEELGDLREPDGAVTVTCEFCNNAYRFEASDI